MYSPKSNLFVGIFQYGRRYFPNKRKLEIEMWEIVFGVTCIVGAYFAFHSARLHRDARELKAFVREECAKGRLTTVLTQNGHTLVCRFTLPTRGGKPPVVIANGLAATMCTIGSLHDGVAALGYPVLSYDRLGVGFSDANTFGRSPSVDETMEDMLDVIKAFEAFAAASGISLTVHRPTERSGSGELVKWILIGPSMGSTVAQVFMSMNPLRVYGFVNVDGFPHPFEAERTRFMKAGRMYRVFAAVAALGITRPILLTFTRSFFGKFASSLFPVELIQKQMAQPNFWRNVVYEMELMVDLAHEAARGWGEVALRASRSNSVDVVTDLVDPRRLGNVRPRHCGEFYEAGGWKELPRAASEIGADWEDGTAMRNTLATVAANSRAPLCELWSLLPVRILSARDFSYPGGDSFYSPRMKIMIGAEHSLHALLARDGARDVLPTVGHDKVFLQLPIILSHIEEVCAAGKT